MRDHPETQFAWNGDAAIAYQVLGEGQPDLVYFQGWISNLELNWEQPIVERFLRGLARSRRLIIVDPRGTGVTDSLHRPPTSRHSRRSWTTSPWCSTPSARQQPRSSRQTSSGFRGQHVRGNLSGAHARRDRVRDERELAMVSGDPLGLDRGNLRFAEQEDWARRGLVPSGGTRGRSGIDAIAR